MPRLNREVAEVEAAAAEAAEVADREVADRVAVDRVEEVREGPVDQAAPAVLVAVEQECLGRGRVEEPPHQEE